MNTLKRIFFLSLIIFAVTTCKELKIPGKIFEASERVRYERSYSGADSLMVQWKNSFSSAIANRLIIGESNAFTFFADQPQQDAVGYSLELKQGDLLVIEATGVVPQTKIFC
ncbi:hypothetical protein [uncultured Chryseobacterium sp.]|uniref:hypothetical protein n=1 Tax=uncultured Chryseobacterium sp. TaxID=259322 RepID=UPI00374A08CB